MVKYVDGPSTSVVVGIEAPPSLVWPLLCDINLPGRFSEEFVRGEWIDDGPAGGATFRGHNRHEMVGEWCVLHRHSDGAGAGVRVDSRRRRL